MNLYDVVSQWLALGGRAPVLPQSEVARLTRVIQSPLATARQKRRATDKLVQHNLKLVAHVTQRYLGRRTFYGTSDDRVLDYLQQGALGLIHASKKFDPDLGYQFSTYATRWILSYLGKYHYSQAFGVVHVPENVVCAVLNNRRPVKLGAFIDCAVSLKDMDSLERLVPGPHGGLARLGEVALAHPVR